MLKDISEDGHFWILSMGSFRVIFPSDLENVSEY